MTSNAVEFLNELEEQEGIQVLHSCFNLKSELTLKNDIDPQPCSARIHLIDNGRILLETNSFEKILKFTGITSIKFFIGTEVYFVKTVILAEGDNLYFDYHAKVIQLKRRKEPRYNIPEKWNQSAAVWSIALKIQNRASVIDISSHGIRLEIPVLSLDFKKGDTIRIQFQIYKRAEVVCDAIAKFILRKQSGATIMGLEFTGLQKSHRSRIYSIVDDLENYLVQQT